MGDLHTKSADGGRLCRNVSVQTVSVDDHLDVTYAEYGTPSGTPVVFFHGTPGSHLLGQLFHDRAKQCNVRLLAPNRPGYSNSTPCNDWTLSDTGAFLSAVLADAKERRARVIAFSGGGPHALAAASSHHELVAGVDIISGTTPRSVMDSVPTPHRILGILAEHTPLLLRGLFRTQAAIAKHTSPEFIVSQYASAETLAEIPEEVSRLVKQDFIEAFRVHRSGAVTESRLFSREWEIPIQSIETRVRFWHGTRDEVVPIEACQRLQNRVPNSQLITLDGADHLSSLLRCRDRVLSKPATDTGSGQNG